MLEEKLKKILEDYIERGDFRKKSYLDLYIDNDLFIDITYEEFMCFVKNNKLEYKNIDNNASIGSFYIEK
ncbi:hypothetical protein [Anaerococcus sp. AGMB09787]|uniref:hypothetical protein n=1 Tax=Anaerococcus sp. AGMB09787 TaxID=2922869 RepID=UPI001FAFF470|nr:hypothetical protein [Anaerococcus sp. AGMB09787]